MDQHRKVLSLAREDWSLFAKRGRVVAQSQASQAKRSASQSRHKCKAGFAAINSLRSTPSNRYQLGTKQTTGSYELQANRRGDIRTGIGQRYGSLVVIGWKRLLSMWRCRCDCGHTCTAKSRELRTGQKTDCGRVKGHRAPKVTVRKPVEELKPGSRVGRWTVLGPVQRGPHNRARSLVLCQCGWFYMRDDQSSKSGASQSCGCLKNEVTRQRMTSTRDHA